MLQSEFKAWFEGFCEAIEGYLPGWPYVLPYSGSTAPVPINPIWTVMGTSSALTLVGNTEAMQLS